MGNSWPKGPRYWQDGRTLFVSVPFTWNLQEVKRVLEAGSWFWDRAAVGGPAVDLMPEYLAGIRRVEVGGRYEGALQVVNPMATRTTVGCPNRCAFCAIGQGRIEGGGFRELPTWPNLPIVCDNNILAASDAHLERVVRGLREWGWADFNQGLEAALLTPERAKMLSSIGKPICRLACDSFGELDAVGAAVEMLRSAGVAKARIRVYALVGYKSGPDEAAGRCDAIEALGVKPYPMWYHALDCLTWNGVSPEQEAWGWTKGAKDGLFGWHYQHRRQGDLRGSKRPPKGQGILSLSSSPSPSLPIAPSPEVLA